MDFLAFAVSAFAAQILTNLDNLAALLALMVVAGTGRAVTGFLAAQTLVILAAYLFAIGVEDVIPDWAGYLGLVPLMLGVVGFVRQFRKGGPEDVPDVSPKASTIAISLLFISLSMDTFAVLAPLLADSALAFRTVGVIGAAAAALLLATVALLGARTPLITSGLARRLERLVPYVMICAGLYILSNSWTDTV